MKEILAIIKDWQAAPRPMALATIVETPGSDNLRTGNRMLIHADGRTTGCITSNCHDKDVVRRGLHVLESRKPALMACDTTSDRDRVFNAERGCRSAINIFIECVPPKITIPGADNGFLGFLEKLIELEKTGATATVIETNGDIHLRVGDRVALNNVGRIESNVRDARGRDMLEVYAQFALADQQTEIIEQQTMDGSARIFVETILPQPRVAIPDAARVGAPAAG